MLDACEKVRPGRPCAATAVLSNVDMDAATVTFTL